MKRYKVLIESKAKKQMSKLDLFASRRIKNWIDYNLDGCVDPYRYGRRLQGNFSNCWRYRVGNYRIIAEIDNEKIIILIVQIGHRKDVYRWCSS